jgi:hypothetical protein
MNPLDLLSYASDNSNDSDSGDDKVTEQIASDEKVTKQIEPASNGGGIRELEDGTICQGQDSALSQHSNQSTSKFEILPVSSRRQEPDPQTVHTVEKYLELKEISGFDLTEVISFRKITLLGIVHRLTGLLV